jgi:hypothetical protein
MPGVYWWEAVNTPDFSAAGLETVIEHMGTEWPGACDDGQPYEWPGTGKDDPPRAGG